MTTIALQQELIDKISKIRNKKTLVAIKKYVELDCEVFHTNGSLRLTPEMQQLLEKSEKQYENKQVTSHEQLMTEMDIWLRERQ